MSTERAARLLNEGWELQQAGNFNAAIKKYQAILHEPTEEKEIPMLAFLNQGNISYDRKDYDKALSLYRKAAEANPSSDAPYYNAANVFRDMQKYGDAIAFYQLAIQRNPLDPDCRRNLALVYATIGDNPHSATELEKCVELSGDNPDTRDYFNLGVLYNATGNEMGAMLWLDRFVKSAPADYAAQVATAKKLLSSIKAASGFDHTHKRLVVRDGCFYVVSE